MSGISHALSVILIIIGLFFISGLIVSFLLCSKDEEGIFTLVYCNGDYDKLYEKVYAAFFQRDFFSFYRKRDIIVIAEGVPKKIRRQCEDITEPFGKVYFASKENLTELCSSLLAIKH